MRRAGAWCGIVLMLLVAGERRLSEMHFDLRSWGAGLESADALDGDEIRVRLIALNDDKPPSLSDAGRALTREMVHAPVVSPEIVPLGRPVPRGPPPSAGSR